MTRLVNVNGLMDMPSAHVMRQKNGSALKALPSMQHNASNGQD